MHSAHCIVYWVPLFMAALCNRAGHIYFHPVVCSFFFFPRLILAIADWMSTILPHMVCLSANLECRCETCCKRLAQNTERRKSPSGHHHTTVGPYLCNWDTYRQLEKNLLSSNIFSTCPRNMVNFVPLAAEIDPVVWGTPANFNGFRVLVALLHGTLIVGVGQTLRRWTEGATYIRQGGHQVGHWPTF